MDESELNRKDILSLQPLVDLILDSIQQCLQSLSERVHSLLLVMQVFISEDFGVIDDSSFVLQELHSLFVLLQTSAEKLESLIAEGRHSSRCEEEEHLICAQVS